MHCCANCFNDKFIEKQIKALSEEIGTCPICGSQDANLIDATFVGDFFQQVLDLYEVDAKSGLIAPTLLKKDWEVFPNLQDDQIIKLLNAMFPGEDYQSTLYSPIHEADHDMVQTWNKFRKELMHENRYFPLLAPDKKGLRKLVSYLELPANEMPVTLFRARIQLEGKGYSLNKMGPPDKGIASEGRANPRGIPYLYLASDDKTAVEECRPHISEKLSVAKFGLATNLRLVDLRNPRSTISPFKVPEETLPSLYKNIGFLCHLGEEISKPVIPRMAHLEYLPSQYLCELLKHYDYDGVVYRSSVGSGDNYAIFNEYKMTRLEVDNHIVIKSDIETIILNDQQA